MENNNHVTLLASMGFVDPEPARRYSPSTKYLCGYRWSTHYLAFDHTSIGEFDCSALVETDGMIFDVPGNEYVFRLDGRKILGAYVADHGRSFVIVTDRDLLVIPARRHGLNDLPFGSFEVSLIVPLHSGSDGLSGPARDSVSAPQPSPEPVPQTGRQTGGTLSFSDTRTSPVSHGKDHVQPESVRQSVRQPSSQPADSPESDSAVPVTHSSKIATPPQYCAPCVLPLKTHSRLFSETIAKNSRGVSRSSHPVQGTSILPAPSILSTIIPFSAIPSFPSLLRLRRYPASPPSALSSASSPPPASNSPPVSPRLSSLLPLGSCLSALKGAYTKREH